MCGGVVLCAVVTVLAGCMSTSEPVVTEGSIPDPDALEVLVATEDIPACTASDEWADSMELVWMDQEDVPVGALKSTDVLEGSLLTRNLTAGDVIKAQYFGNYRKEPCVVEAG
jgi:hypothetical protein